MTVYRLEELFPPEIEERLKIFPAVILPLGTISGTACIFPLGSTASSPRLFVKGSPRRQVLFSHLLRIGRLAALLIHTPCV